MDGRRSPDVEQPLGAAPARSIRSEDAARHASQPDQGRRAHRLRRVGSTKAGVTMTVFRHLLAILRLPFLAVVALPFLVLSSWAAGDTRWGSGPLGGVSPGAAGAVFAGG